MPDWLPPSLETTRQLLDGAIAAAESSAQDPGEDGGSPEITRERWAWHLLGQRYCAANSVALMAEAAARFDAMERPDLAAFAREKHTEETGHDLIALADLNALGFDADALVDAVAPPPSVAALVRFARTCVRGEHPVDFLGYMFSLERRALLVPAESIAAAQALAPPGADVTANIRQHATCFDVAHVESALRFIAELPAGDRTRVAVAAFRATEAACFPDHLDLRTAGLIAEHSRN